MSKSTEPVTGRGARRPCAHTSFTRLIAPTQFRLLRCLRTGGAARAPASGEFRFSAAAAVGLHLSKARVKNDLTLPEQEAVFAPLSGQIVQICIDVTVGWRNPASAGADRGRGREKRIGIHEFR